jgi:ketosteroid isomerase-like protein
MGRRSRVDRLTTRPAFNEIVIFHIRDGRITEVWEAYGDLYEIDEFWS